MLEQRTWNPWRPSSSSLKIISGRRLARSSEGVVSFSNELQLYNQHDEKIEPLNLTAYLMQQDSFPVKVREWKPVLQFQIIELNWTKEFEILENCTEHQVKKLFWWMPLKRKNCYCNDTKSLKICVAAANNQWISKYVKEPIATAKKIDMYHGEDVVPSGLGVFENCLSP